MGRHTKLDSPQPRNRPPPQYTGHRVTVLGLGRQGLATARFFLSSGARVTVSDIRRFEELAVAVAELKRFAASCTPGDLKLALGGHPIALLDDCDLLCLSGGVSPAIPIVRAAVERGIPLSNDGQLTLKHCPVPVIGITGSAGKTTTTTLVGLMLEAAGFRVHVGGNIGTPLLDRLEEVGPGDKVVMELSSFQLELFDSSPAVAAILNITPNHLDRHPSMSHYAAAKANILRFQTRGDTCALNADDAYTGPWLQSGRCFIPEGSGQPAVHFPLMAIRLWFSLTATVDAPAGALLRGDRLLWRRPGLSDVEICRTSDIQLRGRHNLANILAACCISGAAGANAGAMATVATTFGGVEHRLEVVRRRGGTLWVNDSIATAPERTVAALRSFNEPIILLAGGRDKHLPWDQCIAVMHEPGPGGSQRVRHVVLFGEAADLIGSALRSYEQQTAVPPMPTTRCPDLPTAVAAAAELAQDGDVVLLAPGGTSFDAYEDFAARGQHFRALVEALP